MSFHVDPKTLLFNHMTEEEADELYSKVKELVLVGTTMGDHPAFLAWAGEAKLTGTAAGLAHATAFPQRALLSIIEHWAP